MSIYYDGKKTMKHSKRGKGVDCLKGKSLKIEIINNIPQPFPTPLALPTAPPQPINLEIKQASNQSTEDIQSTVDVITSVMTEFKTDVNVMTNVMTNIESDVNVVTSVMSEIKTDVNVVTAVVTDIQSDVNVVTDVLTSPTIGLAEIQRELSNVEEVVLNSNYGLETLAANQINSNNNLFTVRNEIIGRVNEIGPGRAKLTSGPWIATNQYLEIRVLNTTDATAGPITVTAYDLDQNPRVVLLRNPIPTPITATFYISPNCSKVITFIYDMNGDLLEPLTGKVVELEFSGLSEGVYVYSRTTDATRTDINDVFNSYCFL